MGLLDKFLSALKLNDEYEDDDDFLDDDDLDEEVKPSKKTGFFRKSAEKDDFEDFDEYDREYDDEPIIRRTLKDKSKTGKTSPVTKTKAPAPAPAKPASATSKISAMRPGKKSANDMSLCVVKPKSMEDAREITETLVSNCTVVLNLEGIDIDLAQRIVDFTSGSIYALNGGLQRVNNTIFIITPQNVDISGDITDLLNGAFDIPSMNFNY